MKNSIIAALSVIAVSLAAGPAAAQEARASNSPWSGTGLSLKAGTAGFGVDLTKAFSEKFKVRAGYSTYEYSTNRTEEDINYDAKLRLAGFSVLADLHPWAGGLRVTAGGYSPKHRISGAAKYIGATSTVTINDRVYSSDQLQNLTIDAKWSGFRPYLGLGYDGFNKTSAGLFFTADAGVIFAGSPGVRLQANCVDASVCAQAAADIAAEEAKLRNDISGAKYLPVLQIGVGYRF